MSKGFLRWIDWFLSHCANEKENEMCKHWGCDGCGYTCKGIPMDVIKPECTGWEPKKEAQK